MYFSRPIDADNKKLAHFVILVFGLIIFQRILFNISFLYFISPKGGPTFNVRRVYTSETSNNTQHRQFF